MKTMPIFSYHLFEIPSSHFPLLNECLVLNFLFIADTKRSQKVRFSWKKL